MDNPEEIAQRTFTEARHTLCDTPIHTAIYHPAEETLALWK
jgi:hypothetical protein